MTIKKRWKKFLNWFLDLLMFVVPILEVSEVIAVIPYEYLPWYMLATVVLRRGARLLEEYLEKRYDDVHPYKEQ